MAETPYVREPGYALRYRDQRFHSGSGAKTDQRERKALRALLALAAARPGRWLDVPSGAGRMSDELPGEVVQVDKDPGMVQAIGQGRARLCASVHQLPFADRTFTGVFCHRLLQHIPTAVERCDILRELHRVTDDLLIVSFFDARSLQHLRRTLRRWLGKTRSGRCAVARGTFLAELRTAGWQPLATRALRRFLGEQTLVLCRRSRPHS